MLLWDGSLPEKLREEMVSAMSPELEAGVWRFVELVARGNTEFSELEAMADELLEMRCQEMQSAEAQS